MSPFHKYLLNGSYTVQYNKQVNIKIQGSQLSGQEVASMYVSVSLSMCMYLRIIYYTTSCTQSHTWLYTYVTYNTNMLCNPDHPGHPTHFQSLQLSVWREKIVKDYGFTPNCSFLCSESGLASLLWSLNYCFKSIDNQLQLLGQIGSY